MKSKAKALQHFKVDSILKTDKTVYKQAKSMCAENQISFDSTATSCS